MLVTVLLVLFFLALPALVLLLAERRIALVHKIGPILVCYAVGLVIGNVGLLPASAAGIQDAINTAAVPLALPLLFFSLDVRGWARSGPKAVLSFALEAVAVSVMCVLGFFLFRTQLGAEANKVAGMLFGVYSGGTINLAAISAALQADPALYVAANASDMIASGLYLLFLMTVGKRLIRKILPPSESEGTGEATNVVEDSTSFRGLLSGGVILPLAGALGLALLIAAAGASLTFVLPGGWGTIAAILAVTTLGILASLVEPVRRIRLTFALGQYFIMVFSLVVGSMAKLSVLVSTAPMMVAWVGLAVFGSLVLHLLFAAIFKIDADTMIVTSVAGVCSPPFVPMIAASLKNKRVIVPGVITGIIGWVLGTYLGIGLSLILGAAG